MKEYKPVMLPFSPDFAELPKSKQKEFFKWFMDIIPERLEMLANFVQSTEGYADWIPDFSPDSLIKLGEWYYNAVETREKTEEEIANVPEWIGAEPWTLNYKTRSIAFDVGIYFGNVILRNVSGIKWKIWDKGKKSVDYGKPVLIGAKENPLQPYHIMEVLAFGYADKSRHPSKLRELYDIWKESLQGR